MRILRTSALVFLLALPLGSSGAFGAQPRASLSPQPAVAAAPGLLSQLGGFLLRLWSPAGCELDPLGHTSCHPTGLVAPRPVPAADAGCELDPLGRCAAQR